MGSVALWQYCGDSVVLFDTLADFHNTVGSQVIKIETWPSARA